MEYRPKLKRSEKEQTNPGNVIKGLKLWSKISQAIKTISAAIRIQQFQSVKNIRIMWESINKILNKHPIYIVKTSPFSDLLLTLLGPFFISVQVPLTFQVPAFV